MSEAEQVFSERLLDAAFAHGGGDGCISPYGVWVVLAMLLEGAREPLAQDLASALGLPLRGGGSTVASLADALERRIRDVDALHPPDEEESGGFEHDRNHKHGGALIRLRIANALWISKRRSLNAKFAALAARDFRARFEEIDFSDRNSACAIINSWVRDETDGRIAELVKPVHISTDLTSLIITSAMYFKARWDAPFDRDLTTSEPFFGLGLDRKSSSLVPMMHTNGHYSYLIEQNYLTAVRLPYVGSAFSMLILMPDDLVAFERTRREPGWMERIILRLERSAVHVAMPRFRVRSSLELSEALRSLGLARLFDELLLHGLVDGGSKQGERVSKVLHEAFVEVDESGTEAAAATAAVIATGAAYSATPKVVRIDRPFLFAIRDDASGAILFLGRVTNPAAGVTQK